MKISLRWLSRYVDLSDQSPEAILADLTMSTAEVEGIERYAPPIPNVVTGHVLTREKHPDADKLSITTVDAGVGETLQIVCGAPNVAAGQKVVIALPGASLPGGLTIKKAKIRGAESCGMICSESELALSASSSGILVLDAATPVGKPYDVALGVGDHVLEIDNKSINHRPDLWGHVGIARELAAILDRPLRAEVAPWSIPASGDSPRIEIADLGACPRYMGLWIDGVRAAPSPNWLRWALAAVGQRSIDLLVDLTNFVMLDLGQPLHAFDADKLAGRTIGVRFARSGERMVTLDGVDRELRERDLLIVADDRPAALAGVMGGEATKVDSSTRAILLESANFHPATIRRTSTRLGLRSDASARYEKSLDPTLCEVAVHRFLGLLGAELPDLRVRGPIADPAAWRYQEKRVTLRKSRLGQKLGVTLPDRDVRGILERLSFQIVETTGDRLDVVVPSFRATKDIAIEDDLIEEVGRMFRYDNIPEVPLRSAIAVPERNRELWLCRALAELSATELGAHEVYNYSFVADALLEATGLAAAPAARVTNPVAPEIARIRRHVIPSLLGSLRGDLRRVPEVLLFEDGKGYHPEHRDEHGLPKQVREFAFAFARRGGEHPYAELRNGLCQILERLGHPPTIRERLASPPPFAHPGRTARIDCGATPIGYVGHLHPKVARDLDLDAAVAIATIDVGALLGSPETPARYRPLSAFPPQPVDVALSVPRGTSVAAATDFLRAMGRHGGEDLVDSVELFETYEGEGIPGGHRSLNFTVVLLSRTRTLSGKDEESYLDRVRRGANEIGATMRG
jgi:phenylalanyl-tRNA synthetase beta chain